MRALDLRIIPTSLIQATQMTVQLKISSPINACQIEVAYWEIYGMLCGGMRMRSWYFRGRNLVSRQAPIVPRQLCIGTAIYPSNVKHGGESHRHNTLSRLLQLLKEPSAIGMAQLKQIHSQTLRSIPRDHPQYLFLYSRILHFSSLADLHYATRFFNHFQNPNSFMWNTLIRAYARSTHFKDRAIELYRAMMENELVVPDKHTYPFVLKACAYMFYFFEGKQMHGHILKLGLESDIHVCNSLIHFYATCGYLDLAQIVFDKMFERSKVSWNVLIDSYVRVSEFDTALKLFIQMQNAYEPDNYTMQSVISACAGLGALSLGLWAHAYILKKSEMDMADDVLINTCLVDMYCKCGSLEIAEQVFESMPDKDVNSWNSMILGLAMHGKAEAALDCFTRMVKTQRFVPNSITFVSVLSACNHRGKVNEGLEYFDMMIKEYNIEPRLEHYGCLVDLLARAGRIEEALNLVSEMPMKPDAVIWRSLLDACCKQQASVELSEEMAQQIFESEGSDCSGVYVLLSKVYASARRWDNVGSLRQLMTDKGVTKEPGCSLVEIDGVTHEFFAGDTTHPQSEHIYKFLNVIDEKLESIGYAPDYSGAPMVDEIDDGRQSTLRLHSERLAIAFGLLNSKPGVPIRIFKNLRVCNDCHKVIKLISRIYNVEIIIRDRIRFHHFKDGTCSCKDYW
ncbi:pentatricopeptide repeat-containing protein At1g59720, chloroplastic/mitochondrial-like [Prosopis cineraria]|uniref:pentatricopeptide repeat-containing protein At1g59720, chloroplastic/mitochondrial-like n=1 Tax=Prosopis cineraria TaxID=364024 RepID=UPI002410A35D|nr:pentatricopeptide repeat-containing protein At1g59720, chloroplastic/mitochondrial-like [Prosopis cineraria]XP_054794237.1 pentatricopeptide repeat-containing protein At1g59720, chloroplastic/mitochondrial-like [Prosopis cineraria]